MHSRKIMPRKKSKLIELIDSSISKTEHINDIGGFRGFLITKWDGNPYRQFDRDASNVIIIEHRPPDIDGIRAAKDILASYPKMKLVIVSGEDGVEERAKEAGATRFLKNPISFIDLQKIIDELSSV